MNLNEQIEQEAHSHILDEYPEFDFTTILELVYVDGALSPSAKAYHTQGMYSEEEVKQILFNWNMYEIGIEIDRLNNAIPNILRHDEWFDLNKKSAL